MVRLGYSETQHKRALAYVLKAVRRKAGVSQESAAECAGITRQHLARLETGHHIIRLDHLIKLAACYKLATEEMVTRIERRLEFYSKRENRN
jgi:transcriptional regulator with XRE-family HTH domain